MKKIVMMMLLLVVLMTGAVAQDLPMAWRSRLRTIINENATYSWDDGDRYKGETGSVWQIHGIGVYSFANGAAYFGHFQNGVRSGIGIYMFPDGQIFAGNFSGKRNGYGYQFDKTGKLIYEGNYSNDQATGTFPSPNANSAIRFNVVNDNGDFYLMTTYNGVGHGMQAVLFRDGALMINQIENHEFRGHGIIINSDGTTRMRGNWNGANFTSASSGSISLSFPSSNQQITQNNQNTNVCRKCNNTREITCTICNGTKEIRCPSCQGNGRVYMMAISDFIPCAGCLNGRLPHLGCTPAGKQPCDACQEVYLHVPGGSSGGGNFTPSGGGSGLTNCGACSNRGWIECGGCSGTKIGRYNTACYSCRDSSGRSTGRQPCPSAVCTHRR